MCVDFFLLQKETAAPTRWRRTDDYRLLVGTVKHGYQNAQCQDMIDDPELELADVAREGFWIMAGNVTIL